jgi:hypothetical protein
MKGKRFPLLAPSKELQDAAMSPDAGATSTKTMISAVFLEFLSAQDLAIDFQKGNRRETSGHWDSAIGGVGSIGGTGGTGGSGVGGGGGGGGGGSLLTDHEIEVVVYNNKLTRTALSLLSLG